MCWYVQVLLDQVDFVWVLFYLSFDIKVFFGLDFIYLYILFKKISCQFNFILGLKLLLFDGGWLNVNFEGMCVVSNMMIECYNQLVLNVVCDVVVNGMCL